MKHTLIYIWFAIVALLFSSCSKFLEERSQSEIIPKTATDFSELLLGAGYQGQTDPMAVTLLMSDDFEFFVDFAAGTNSEYSNVLNAKVNYPYYSWQYSCQDFNGNNDAINTSLSDNSYAKYYSWIMGCNAVLDLIDNALGTQEERDRVKSETLANRAFHYFRLVNLYGEPYNHPDYPNGSALGVPLKLESAITHEYLDQNTVAEVYDQIVSDLKSAIDLARPLPEIKGDFRINLTTMHIILSRVYLYMENWEGVVAHADTAFQRGIRHFDMTKFTFTETTPPSYLTYDNPEVQWVYGGSSYSSIMGYYNPPMNVIQMFGTNWDAREKFGFRVNTSENNKVYFYKMLSAGTNTLNQAIRTAEACLNRAEANAMLNNLTEAAEDLNTLRQNRIFAENYADVTYANREELIQLIRHERRLEFFGEHFRWFDLRRYGMPEIKHRYKHSPSDPIITYTLKEKDPMYTLPFPRSLMLNNPNLIQNASASIPTRVGVVE
ncbi:MAG: RagB/SusD family nutrient uptake outer membrane protein [Bacteroidales bacterium]|jgi:hypothetical protein|nr:RagB/SusD family nutrient uptake outer membrane protein [Bacteroidales bacterium]